MGDYPENIIDAVLNDCDGCVDETALALADIATRPYELTRSCRKWLSNHGYCEKCGNELAVMHSREYHSEVDAYEPYCEKYCPICDLGG